MSNNTPFLTGFPYTLFGRKRRSEQVKLRLLRDKLAARELFELSSLLNEYIPHQLLESHAGEYRKRTYDPHTTFWAFLAQSLSGQASCHEIVAKLQSLFAKKGLPIPSSNTSAYSQARGRLRPELLDSVHRHLKDQFDRGCSQEELWLGHCVRVLDGTGIRLLDTEINQKHFPQSREQKPGCGFPSMKLVGLLSLETGSWQEWAVGNEHQHESVLGFELVKKVEASEIVLADRGFSSYAMMAQLWARDISCVFTLHHRRQVDFRKGKRLGSKDTLVCWKKPQRSKLCPLDKESWAKLPKELQVRVIEFAINEPGYRSKKIRLATTLTDSQKYPKEKLMELYLRRWEIELSFRDIKTTLGMEELGVKSPEMVNKAVQITTIGYNVLRLMMLDAAKRQGLRVRRLSFKAALDVLRSWASSMEINWRWGRKKLREYRQNLLEVLASNLLLERPKRSEPRAVKRRPKNYQLLNKPRHQMIVAPHRNRWKSSSSNKPKLCLS